MWDNTLPRGDGAGCCARRVTAPELQLLLSNRLLLQVHRKGWVPTAKGDSSDGEEQAQVSRQQCASLAASGDAEQQELLTCADSTIWNRLGSLVQ